MAEHPARPGSIAWRDLTVPDAGRVRDFYAAVIGWRFSDQSMGSYDDYNIVMPDSEEVVAGLCHARGANADLPAAWLMYVVVENVEASAQAAIANGGAVLSGPRAMGGGRFAVIQDPAGAVIALWQHGPGA